jgi:hypothetical protein
MSRVVSRFMSEDMVVFGFVIGVAVWTYVALPLIHYYWR